MLYNCLQLYSHSHCVASQCSVHIHVTCLLCHYVHVVLPDENIGAEHHNPAVSSDVLKEIWEWKQQGATLEDVIDRLRSRTVPPGYVPHPWTHGENCDTCICMYVCVVLLHNYSCQKNSKHWVSMYIGVMYTDVPELITFMCSVRQGTNM